MGGYNFQPRFAEFVRVGTKTHTVRGKRKKPDKPGSTFFGFTGMRTLHCERLIIAPVSRVEDFLLERARVWIAGAELSVSEKDLFAWRDGFRYHDVEREPTDIRGCFDMMLQFWIDTRRTTEFVGDVIHWNFDAREIERKRQKQHELR